MLNYYKILEIPDFSNEKTIKGAYRSLSKKYHPDVNNDPAASDYFITINSAYEFLMDENKRLLLDQFLKATTQVNYQKSATSSAASNTSQTYQQGQPKPQDFRRAYQSPPVVQNFSCDRLYYTLGDYILISWNVSQCKSVRVSILGNVDFVGSCYYLIDKYTEKLEIVLHIIGLDDREYTSKIMLYYKEDNRYKEAFHKISNQYPDADPKHFVKETLFDSHGRLGKKEFTYRMIVLSVFLFLLLICYFLLNAKMLVFMLLFVLVNTIVLQVIKRTQDSKVYKKFSCKKILPLWDISYLKDLFVLEGEPGYNEYGIQPKNIKMNFWRWMFSIEKQFTWFDGLKISSSISFVLLILALIFKVNAKYDEVPIEMKHTYAKSNTKNTDSSYLLIFEGGIEVEIEETDYVEIFKNKEFLTYKAGLNNRNEIQYIKVLNANLKELSTFKFGALKNTNPILIFIVMLFIAHMFAMVSLKKQEELIYAKGILLFILLINFFILIQM